MVAGALAVRVRAPSLSLSVARRSGWEAGGASGGLGAATLVKCR